MSVVKSKLKGRDPSTVEPSKPKIVVYGPSGIGKTWFALDFPSVYYVDTEGGADLGHYRAKLKAAGGMYFGPEDGALDFGEVLGQVKALATEQHDRKTLVIDSVSKLFNNQIALTQEKMDEAKEKDAFGASKKPAVGYMRRLVSWIQKLDMNVVLIHHQKDKWGKNEKGDQEVIGMTYDGWDRLEYELHLVVRVERNGPARTAVVGKSRLEQFPENTRFPWSFTEFSNRYGAEVIGRAAVPLNLCTTEQQAEFKSLVSRVKIDPAVTEKWESAVPDIALLDAANMTRRIDWLKTQLVAPPAA